jgi:hypothetical protein
MWAMLESLIIQGKSLIACLRQYYECHNKLDEWGHSCASGQWVTTIYSDIELGESIIQVIMIARLRAMYQGSKKMLIFLAVVFLAINIVCGVMLAMGFEHIVGGKLYYDGSNNHAHCMIFRRAPPLWHLWVRIQLREWRPTADHNGLDSQHGMGGPCIVSCNLDCYKTLPRTARAINSVYRRGLFHRVNQNSCAVFCNVSCYFEYCGYLLIPWHFACASFVAASCLHIGFLSRKISVRSSVTLTS